MYQIIDPPKCSKCGARNSETFQRFNSSGRRCISCGHEQTATTTAGGHDDSAPTVYQLKPEDRTF